MGYICIFCWDKAAQSTRLVSLAPYSFQDLIDELLRKSTTTCHHPNHFFFHLVLVVSVHDAFTNHKRDVIDHGWMSSFYNKKFSYKTCLPLAYPRKVQTDFLGKCFQWRLGSLRLDFVENSTRRVLHRSVHGLLDQAIRRFARNRYVKPLLYQAQLCPRFRHNQSQSFGFQFV